MKRETLTSRTAFRLPAIPVPSAWVGSASGKDGNGARPFVKWAGGKSQLLAQLKPLYPTTFSSYFEPFLGGGAVYFDLTPSKAFLNDVNPALVACYSNVKRRLDAVIDILRDLEREYLQADKEDRNALFYKIREEYNGLRNSLPQKTAYLIFLNKTCFNGMYRESSTGRFNVPFGRYENPRICDEDNLKRVSAMLKHASLTSVSFEDAVRSAKHGDFVYFDPPYHPLSQTASFTSYHAGDFGEADQINLRDLFVELHERGCLVMLSNSYAPFIQDLYKGFAQHTVMASRAINCKASGRGRIRELVITSY